MFFKKIVLALLLLLPTSAMAMTPDWVMALDGLDEVENKDHVACVALGIYYEARGESIKGQHAVGSVIMNRSRSGKYPNDPCGVIFQKRQFGFYKGGPLSPSNKNVWTKIVDMAKAIVNGEVSDVTNGKLSFYNPSDSTKKVRGFRIGNHIFH